MFLTVHGAIGVIIGQNISNPLLALITGFISHYIFDIIPHGDTKAPEKYKNPIHIGLAAIIDFSVLLIFLIYLFFSHINILQPSIILAVIGALMPDLLQAAYFFLNKKVFWRWQMAHIFFHDKTIADKFDWPFTLGILFQIIFFIILVILIL